MDDQDWERFLAEQRQDFTALATDVRGYMERTITLIGEGFTAVRGEISDLRTDMDAGIAELRADMTAGFTGASSAASALATSASVSTPCSCSHRRHGVRQSVQTQAVPRRLGEPGRSACDLRR